MTQGQRIDGAGKRLARWYRRNGRDLPWRGRSDPYAIWVSEVMLQQTRVSAVVPYYARFLERFPDVAALADATLDDVLKAWEGMGYYGRARNLHAAARRVVAEFAGQLPRSIERLRELPGIGRYTAGAIASIAFDLDEPVLDGNVTRVLCRVFAVGADPRRAPTQKKLWALARKIIPPGRAGMFNQAMMDLGATVCVPRRPSCDACPLAKTCLALARGRQEELPVRAARKPTPHYDIAAAVVWRARRILIARRRPKGLLGGLWEFPGGKRQRGETLRAAVVREVREEVGLDVTVRRALVNVDHAYSHFRITLHVFECDPAAGRARAIVPDAVRWVRLAELDAYAFPAANRRVIAALRRARRT